MPLGQPCTSVKETSHAWIAPLLSSWILIFLLSLGVFIRHQRREKELCSLFPCLPIPLPDSTTKWGSQGWKFKLGVFYLSSLLPLTWTHHQKVVVTDPKVFQIQTLGQGRPLKGHFFALLYNWKHPFLLIIPTPLNSQIAHVHSTVGSHHIFCPPPSNHSLCQVFLSSINLFQKSTSLPKVFVIEWERDWETTSLTEKGTWAQKQVP